MIDPKSSAFPSTRFTLPSCLLHDLRTPINHIIGYSEMLIELAQGGAHGDLATDLQKVRRAGKQLLDLISENFISDRGTEALPAKKSPLERESPLREQAGTPSGSAELTARGPTRTAQGLVLIVDDNEGNRDVLARLLQRQAYDVDTAENGLQALDKLNDGTFDLVLLDIMMPEMDGYEVLERLKADERLRHVPVIMISALTELDSVARCIEMGAEDYLPKPFNPTILKARIGACLEKKHARDREMRLYEELQQNYKQLQGLEKLRDDLTHMIIHDLRTPLTSLISGMQTLDVVGDLNEDQQEMKDIALVGGETLLGMINDLLDVEKLESGTMQLDYDIVTVSELVSAACGQIVSLAEDKKLRLVQQVGPELPALLGDENKLRRTLVNLLGNAIKFTPSGGTVTIGGRHSKAERSVEFFVSDTGEGIPAEFFGRIFEKFGQVESRKSGRTMSTGLGLTFCKLAVEAHGGHIELKSAPGLGSTFSFTVPLPSEPG